MKAILLRMVAIATVGLGLGACTGYEAGSYGSAYSYPPDDVPYGGYYGSPFYGAPVATGFGFGFEQERVRHHEFEERRHDDTAHRPAPRHPGPPPSTQAHAAPPAGTPNNAAGAQARAGSRGPVTTSPAAGARAHLSQPQSGGQVHANGQHGRSSCGTPGCIK